MILRWTSQRSSRNASCAPSPQRDAPSSSSRRLAGIAIALAVLLPPGAAAAPPQQLGHQYQQIAFVAPAPAPAPAEAGPSSFSLVHAVHFGTHSHPGLRVQHRFDPADEASYASLALPSSSSSSASSAQLSGEDASFEDSKAALYPAIETFPIRTVRQTIWKPSHPARSEVYEAARRVSMPQFAGDQSLRAIGEQLSWEQVEVASPDVADVTTLSTLAKMSSNAYSTSQDEGWYDLSSNDTSRPSYNLSSSFGWEEDGIRGHVFSSGPANETIVIALKGTSAFVGGGRTGRNDKLNDNLLFSCCCARIDWTWSPVCDCYNGTSSKSGDQRCNLTCLEDALIEKSVYYPTATDLFNNITDMYPRSQIWLTGHSLGGSLAALLGVTFGIPTVTFEAPGDLLPAKRLHLPLPPGSDWSDPDSRPDFGITHVYTNSDPIPQGVCTGTLSTCNLVGFALESKCHTGQSIVYDAVGKLGWSVDIRTHRIGVVIDKLLVANWDGESEEEAGVNAVRKADQQKAATPTLVAERKSWLWPWPGRRRRNESDSPADPTSSTTSSQLPDPTQPTKDRKKSHVPPPKTDHKCIDCFKWEFFDDYEGHRPGQNTSFLGALSRTLP